MNKNLPKCLTNEVDHPLEGVVKGCERGKLS
jgi:hypothetical protein